MANGALALGGAILESVDNGMMRYYNRCDSCGDVPNSTNFTSIPSVGSMLCSTYRCNKCGRTTNVKIKGI
jgi:C4-type Zn-finger protein